MISEVVDPPAVFDAKAVSCLTGDPRDGAFAVVFVTRYRSLLPERVRRISAALAAAEVGDALDAVRSLKAASITVGTHELAEIAGRLERLLRGGDLARAAVVQAALPRAAHRADRALAAYLAS